MNRAICQWPWGVSCLFYPFRWLNVTAFENLTTNLEDVPKDSDTEQKWYYIIQHMAKVCTACSMEWDVSYELTPLACQQSIKHLDYLAYILLVNFTLLAGLLTNSRLQQLMTLSQRQVLTFSICLASVCWLCHACWLCHQLSWPKVGWCYLHSKPDSNSSFFFFYLQCMSHNSVSKRNTIKSIL